MLILALVILFVAVSIWDVIHVNDLVARTVDPAEYRRVHASGGQISSRR